MCKGMENGTESYMCALGPASFRLKMRVVAAGNAEVRIAGKREFNKNNLQDEVGGSDKARWY